MGFGDVAFLKTTLCTINGVCSLLLLIICVASMFFNAYIIIITVNVSVCFNIFGLGYKLWSCHSNNNILFRISFAYQDNGL